MDRSKFVFTFGCKRVLNRLGIFFAQANSNDRDGGILLGRWSNNFQGGTAPLAWTGSTAILEEFWQKKKTVRYGQCWVFSGLVTSCKDILRSSFLAVKLVLLNDKNRNRTLSLK